MYLVYRQNPAGSRVSCVLTISPSFPICFPLFWFHSRCLCHLSIADHVACCQLSSQVSYKPFSAVASPVWLECPIRQHPFPCFQPRSAPPHKPSQLLVLLLMYSGDWAHQHVGASCTSTLGFRYLWAANWQKGFQILQDKLGWSFVQKPPRWKDLI